MPEGPILAPSRGSGLLPRRLSGFIFEDAEQASAVQRVVPREPLPGEGVAIPVITGRPTAAWVAEGGRKPLSDASTSTLIMDPKKLAVIVPFSREFLRTDRVDLFGRLRPMIAEAFAYAFDVATVLGISTPFPDYLAETTHTVELGTAAQGSGGVYTDLVEALGLPPTTDSRFRVRAWLADTTAEVELLQAVDTSGRPLLTNGPTGDLGPNLIGRPFAYMEDLFQPIGANATWEANEGIRLMGFDPRRARWGVGSDIEYTLLQEATLVKADNSLLHLAQDNLAAIRAEAEYGWVVENVQSAVKVLDRA